MIVGLMGMARVGKDTTGAVYIENGYERYAFGDAVKKEYCEVNGLTLEEIDGDNKEYHRTREGGIIDTAEKKRKNNPFYWVDVIKDEIIEKHKKGINIVITDIRRIPEIKFMDSLKEVFGKDNVKLYEVIKPKANDGVFDYDMNTSQTLLWGHWNCSVDGVIYNTETQTDLEIMVDNIIKSYENG